MTNREVIQELAGMYRVVVTDDLTSTIEAEDKNTAIDMAITALEAQEPRLVTKDDFVNADEYGWLPAWCEEEYAGAVYCECICVDALKEKGVRYWTSKPTDEQREAVKWE